MEATTNTETNILKNEYETLVAKVFEKYKINFQNEYEISPNKDECHKDHLTYFKSIVYGRNFNPDKGFFWLSTDPLMNRQFYAHLTSIKKNILHNYNFLNRTIDGNRIDFKTEIIPEIYAGAVWKFYCWLENICDSSKQNAEVDLEVEIKDENIVLPQKEIQSFSGLEIAFLYYFNNTKITTKNIAEIALKHNRTPGFLNNKNFQFLGDCTDIERMIDSKKRNIASKNLYKKMIPFLLEENKQKPVEILNKLEARLMSKKPYPKPEKK